MSASVDAGIREVLRWGRHVARGRAIRGIAVVTVREAHGSVVTCHGRAFGSPTQLVAMAAYLLGRVRADARRDLDAPDASPELARIEAALAELLEQPESRH